MDGSGDYGIRIPSGAGRHGGKHNGGGRGGPPADGKRGGWKHGGGHGGKHRGRGHGGGRPQRYGFAERVPAPSAPPVPEGPPPAAYQVNAFGKVHEKLQYAIADMGYAVPTPIQEQAIPVLLEGRDMVGCAQTGTGKTAAFLLPALHRILTVPRETPPGNPRVLVLSPTRELAAQTAENNAAFSKYAGIPFAVVFGGVSQFHQVKAVQRGAKTLIATPGRLIDLMTQGIIRLDDVEIFVLDEADRMLDMGFLPDIKRIIGKLPAARQSLFFSATLTPEALRLADTLVKDPVKISVAPERPAADKIEQRVMFVDKENKDKLLAHLLETHQEWYRAIVFARTRHNADRIERKLRKTGVQALALHSDKTQAQRTRALESFRKGDTRVLVATDIASRGIDVPDIAAVVNMEFPDEPESYIHRIGRTARAGGSGVAITFVSPGDRGKMKAAEHAAKTKIKADRDQPFHSEQAESAALVASRGGDRSGEPGGEPGGNGGFRGGFKHGPKCGFKRGPKAGGGFKRGPKDGRGASGRGGKPDFRGRRQSDFGRGAPAW